MKKIMLILFLSLNGCLFFSSESVPVLKKDLGAPNEDLGTINEDLGTNDLGTQDADMGRDDFGEPDVNQCVGKECFVQISAGFNHSCAIRRSGELLCWGSDQDERSGDIYKQTEPPEGIFTQVSAGAYFSCAIRTDQSIVCWGKEIPADAQRTNNLSPPLGEFQQIELGAQFACARNTEDEVTCWGRKASFKDQPGEQFKRIRANGQYICGINNESVVRCWGELVTRAPRVAWKSFPSESTEYQTLATGRNGACALQSSGSLIDCWGKADARTMQPLDSLAIGEGFVCGLSSNKPMCFGTIVATAAVSNSEFSILEAGRSHICGILTDGKIKCWGDSRQDRLNSPQ